MFKELNVLQKLRTVSLLQQELFDLITEESGATTANPVLPRLGSPWDQVKQKYLGRSLAKS